VRDNASDFCQEKTRSSSQSGADPAGLVPAHPELSTGFQDDYVLVQEGGGRREPSPSTMITPTRLRQRIKATTRDTGLIHEASFRRSHIPPSETSMDVPQSSDGDNNPFLSEPLIKTVSNARSDTSITENIGKLIKLYFCF